MQVIQLMSGETSAVAGSTSTVPSSDHRDFILTQIEITGTATVEIQGRLNSDYSWIPIHTATASESKLIARYPQMRAEVTAFTSGACSAGIC